MCSDRLAAAVHDATSTARPACASRASTTSWPGCQTVRVMLPTSSCFTSATSGSIPAVSRAGSAAIARTLRCGRGASSAELGIDAEFFVGGVIDVDRPDAVRQARVVVLSRWTGQRSSSSLAAETPFANDSTALRRRWAATCRTSRREPSIRYAGVRRLRYLSSAAAASRKRRWRASRLLREVAGRADARCRSR